MADEHSNKKMKKDKWYLDLMAPNVKGRPYAWLDPSTVYLNAESFQQCVNDLLSPFAKEDIDIVAGIDAMGFILGSAMAFKLGKGFLAIRKKGHLCVSTIEESYTDYQCREKVMEVRQNPFTKGTRVLVVDQWIETGGTMSCAIELMERCGGVVAGVATIACEENEVTRGLGEKYKVHHCVPAGLQAQINSQHLESFKNF